jgi:hypothetical protein
MAGFRDEIARWTHEGAPFELIAERIGRLPASEEDKSALWLWARSHRDDRRYEPTRRTVLAD